MTLSSKYDFIEQALDDRAAQHRLRILRTLDPQPRGKVTIAGKTLINFSSNDYLGLSQHPLVIQTAQEYLFRYGAGATASRLVTGNYQIHEQLEAQFAAFFNRESSLLFTSGFQANFSLLPTLFNRSSLVFCDRLVHNSLLQGILASQATFIRYRHGDLNHLQHCLDQHLSQYQAGRYNRWGIVTESLFSMDGDRTDLAALVALSQEYNTWLYVDDAHALGVYGKKGEGLAAAYPEIDVTIGTLGKAFGSFGAIVGCDRRLKNYWINTCPGVIYTTALPPAVVGAVTAALHLMPSLHNDRQYLFYWAEQVHQTLQHLGYGTLTTLPTSSPSQIIPIVVGTPDQALALEAHLRSDRILGTAIRSPTVPPGTDRIRLALSSVHSPEDYELLNRSLRRFNRKTI